ncbi:MAG: hypothetical protein KatS3mg087_1343 [Patescibacteria group bacterium]|nr:MAG: hypothetical protein KatS3mg087_1343 [Patescibacteria group bacterium]
MDTWFCPHCALPWWDTDILGDGISKERFEQEGCQALSSSIDRRLCQIASNPRAIVIARSYMRRHGDMWRYGDTGARATREIAAVIGCSLDDAAAVVERYFDLREPPLPSTRRLIERLRAAAESGRALIGWRGWRVREDGTLLSPIWGTPWPSDTLDYVSDPRPYTPYAPGISASWAPQYGPHLYAGPWCVIGRVSGHGWHVADSAGWRAERVRIHRLWVDPYSARALKWEPEELRQLLRRKYPGIPVGMRKV